MFERFTVEARQTVVQAQVEARELRHGHIGTEHLLLGLLAQDSAGSAVLARHGLTRDAVAEAVVGYVGRDDLDAVRSTVEATFGPGALDTPRSRTQAPVGHIPFTPRAKKVLELSLREALALKSKSIRDGHIALGLLREGEGLAMKVLSELGVDATQLRRDLTAALRT